jgi:hypothetical protein
VYFSVLYRVSMVYLFNSVLYGQFNIVVVSDFVGGCQCGFWSVVSVGRWGQQCNQYWVGMVIFGNFRGFVSNRISKKFRWSLSVGWSRV